MTLIVVTERSGNSPILLDSVSQRAQDYTVIDSNSCASRKRPDLAVRYGALPFRAETEMEVLLIRRRDCGQWSIPKGNPMSGRRAFEVAAIEAHEEAGLTGSIGATALGSFPHSKTTGVAGRLGQQVEVIVYPLLVTAVQDRWLEMHSRERRWFEPAEASALVSPGLQRILGKLQEVALLAD